ncbi:tetratricopeptide repeat protein [Mesorhizobium sp. B283B1A]|uniref:tetratricopeptide repeat protein n=1 Tax=Mesorhizobium TaxID=68287 RepID=UPI001CD08836|nr:MULTISPECIES: tetratricopeptide repeat protein [Mesorhizobium]MCA0051567.1 tetratricopeptide repeat protein [Mesorhizobium sp. B283B1A]UQS66971.1 tetratricopeptide repeat protein [Mesorhizobium opportunistum]
MQHATPAAPAVRETLERLLASETFGRSERARKLIRYLVEREQAGEADRLKGFSIAMDVFGKDGDFDPSTDAVVRVQAGRLRDLLQQYFANEGVAEPVRIAIPRGGYVPAYELNAIRLPEMANLAGQTEAPAPPSEQPSAVDIPSAAVLASTTVPEPSVARHLRFFWMAIAVVIAMLGVLILRQGSGALLAGGDIPATFEPAGLTGSIARSPASEALPLVYLAVKANGQDASRVAASLRAGLSGFDTVDFIGREAADETDPVTNATSFIFDILPGPGAGDITIELQSMATGRVLLSRNLTAADSAPNAVEDRIADILSSALPASGTIYNYIEQSGMQTGLTQCLLLNGKYYLDQNVRTHGAAYRCLEALADNGAKSSLVYSELASLHLEAVNDHYAYPPDATIEKALTFAHRAIQMGPTSPNAHRAYGYIYSRLGNPDEALRWMRKAYDLNPYDVSMAAAYGYGLIFAGRYTEGTPLLAHAVDASSGHPTWWDFGLFAGEFMLGDMNKATIASNALRTTATKSHYLAARLIGAQIAGQDSQARKLLDELSAKFPKFAANPRATFVDRKYPADLTERLIGALRASGLESAS